MDLKAKIEELQQQYIQWERSKITSHEKMKEIKRKIAKYESVLKAAESIESVEEKPLV